MSGSPSLTLTGNTAGRFSRNDSRPRGRRRCGPAPGSHASRRGARPSDGRRRACATASGGQRHRHRRRVLGDLAPRAPAPPAAARRAGARCARARRRAPPGRRTPGPCSTHSGGLADADDARQEPATSTPRARCRGGRRRSRICASLDASRMSIGRVIVTPTPTAGPLIAAITGFFDSKIRSVTRPPPSRGTSSAPAGSPPPPRVNVSPPPDSRRRRRTRARAGDDHRAHVVVGIGPSNASIISFIIVPVNAFSLSGRLSVMVAMWSLTSKAI